MIAAEFLDPIKWTAEGWTAGAAWVTVVVAVTAAVYARGQVREARALRNERAKPFVVVDFEPHPASNSLMNLTIRNIGQTLAKNVNIMFDPPLQTSTDASDGKYRLNDSRLLREGIPAMPPSRMYTALFDSMISLNEKPDLPRSYVATVQYEDVQGRVETLEYILDLDIYFGLVYVQEKGIHHVASAVEDAVKLMKRWTGSQGRLNVWSRDEDADKEADQIELALTGGGPSLARRPPHPMLMRAGRSVVFRTAYSWVRVAIVRIREGARRSDVS